MTKIVATIPAGNVEYSLTAAEVDIADFIAMLQGAQAEGATHIVGLSGNYRGASYVRLDSIGWQDDEED